MSQEFPVCQALLNIEQCHLFSETILTLPLDEALALLEGYGAKDQLPTYIADLARLESTISRVQEYENNFIAETESLTSNPTLEIIKTKWCGLAEAYNSKNTETIQPGEELILIWHDAAEQNICIEKAEDKSLFALKICAEGLDPLTISKKSNISVGTIDQAIDYAVEKGILIRPPSKIMRQGAAFDRPQIADEFLSTDIFTLQWHITQTCDLHCKHCYDRTSQKEMSLADGLRVLDDFRLFCRKNHVDGQVTFTGGNPLLYPHFFTLYQAAAERNLSTAILGNPAPKEQIAKLAAIQHPVFYQVSLEGLELHNDHIRGKGHFKRVMEFLRLLKQDNIYSMVMLTLTNANQSEVLPVAEMLRDKADLFTFNRLSMVGEGASLLGAETKGYNYFLEEYTNAARHNPVMALKDNMINIIRCAEGLKPFGGCAGHGCGAAFNFVSVLPDGEVQACRKFPSPIGNLHDNSLSEIYASDIATRYRQGSHACKECEIRPVCGGCLAVVHGLGLDPFNDLDPYCFKEDCCK